uniref:Envelope protein n=1 Tax=Panagrolaimus sp. ES5 TaxID=591445 RepID=A0AC34GQI2_9BILA
MLAFFMSSVIAADPIETLLPNQEDVQSQRFSPELVYPSCIPHHITKTYRLIPPQPFNCSMVPTTTYSRRMFETYVPKTRQLLIPIYECNAKVFDIIITPVWKFWKRDYNLFKGYARVHQEECREFVETRLARGVPFTLDGFHQYKSNGHYSKIDDRNHIATIFYVRFGEATTVDLKFLFSPMVDLSACTVKEGSCLLQNSTIVWTVPSEEELCPVVKAGIFTGLVTEDEHMVLLEETQTAFFFSNKTAPEDIVNCTNDKIIKMKNGVYLFTSPELDNAYLPKAEDSKRKKKQTSELYEGEYLSETVDPGTKHMEIEKRPATIADLELLVMIREASDRLYPIRNDTYYGIHPKAHSLMNNATWKMSTATRAEAADTQQMSYFVNSRIQYTIQQMYDRSLRDMNTLFQHICYFHNKDVETSIALMHVSPSEGVRKLLGDRGVVAKWEGSVLLVSRCPLITAQEIHWDQQYKGECFTKPPAIINGSLFFVDLSKQEFVNSAETVSCAARPSLVRKLNNGSYANHMEIIVLQEIQEEKSFKPQKQDIELQAGSIFQSDTNNMLASTKLMSRLLNRILNYEMQIVDSTKKDKEPVVLSIDTIDEIIEQAKNTTKEGFLSSSYNYVKEIAENIFREWKEWVSLVIFMILVPVALYFTRAIWWYFLVKICAYFKCKKRNQNQDFQTCHIVINNSLSTEEALLAKRNDRTDIHEDDEIEESEA